MSPGSVFTVVGASWVLPPAFAGQGGGGQLSRGAPWRTAVQAPTRCILGDGTGCAEMLDPGPGGREVPTASPAALRPASRSSWWPLGAMEEQEVWPKHMEVTVGGGGAGLERVARPLVWGPVCSDGSALALS